MPVQDPLTIDWKAIKALCEQAINTRFIYPNNHFLLESDMRELMEKIARAILDLIKID